VRALVFAVITVAAGCDFEAITGAPTPTPPPRAPAVAATPKQRDDCRDACEQEVIVAQSGDGALRACRSACDARYGGLGMSPIHEVPSRISRAAPVHAPPSVRPR
jgi:hypothetical protein